MSIIVDVLFMRRLWCTWKSWKMLMYLMLNVMNCSHLLLYIIAHFVTGDKKRNQSRQDCPSPSLPPSLRLSRLLAILPQPDYWVGNKRWDWSKALNSLWTWSNHIPKMSSCCFAISPQKWSGIRPEGLTVIKQVTAVAPSHTTCPQSW